MFWNACTLKSVQLRVRTCTILKSRQIDSDNGLGVPLQTNKTNRAWWSARVYDRHCFLPRDFINSEELSGILWITNIISSEGFLAKLKFSSEWWKVGNPCGAYCTFSSTSTYWCTHQKSDNTYKTEIVHQNYHSRIWITDIWTTVRRLQVKSHQPTHIFGSSHSNMK